MKFHLSLAKTMLRLGAYLQSSALMVMNSNDLVEFNRLHYARPATINSWIGNDVVESGLYSAEQQLLDHIPIRSGKMLLLGLGGGREAIPLAKMGFDVTGVDFIPGMVENAIKNAERCNIKIQGLVQEISALNVATDMYDVIWLSSSMYSCLPTRNRRIQMLERIQAALKPGGYFACQFHWDSRQPHSRRRDRILKGIAWLTLGNRSYEPGDQLWGNVEFVHAFSSENELVAELTATGLHLVWITTPSAAEMRGQAVLQKDVRSLI